jgi:serine/threonine protein phosphatase PrpC
MTLQKDDLILLCTDGLTNLVEEQEIKEILMETKGLQASLAQLVELSLQRGGNDNITLLAILLD